MDNFRSGFDPRAILRCGLVEKLSTRALLFEPLFLPTWLVPVEGKAAADVQNSPLPSVELGPSFTIADFDGDNRPDHVRVEAEPKP